MSYKKILVDNLTCSRRFHVAFDDEGKKLAQAEVKCPHCGVVVFSEKNHPEVRMLRDENRVKETGLSGQTTLECAFEDRFSPPSAPKA